MASRTVTVRSAAMQNASLITSRFINPSDSLAKLYRRGVLKIWYFKLEILNGFYVFVHRFSDRSAILTYSSHGRKVFRYHINENDLNELFTMLEYYENDESDQQFIIGRFGFRIRSVGNSVSIGIEYLSHDVEIVGARSQLEAAVARYRSLHRGPARISERKANA